ncbi:LAME_0F15940g1_1 [Lachancea meyersii CBS 8951]|uniref:LAME_0F15940g1_1 n=1 Tax=Lachancea meyersii CBS 8951 TaxID=1266667 RepID=A0A1G4JYR3_9SACH|nr:LAME_0F15940g1_1 [Lachancea meyersii CBS 8951]
MNIIKKFMDSGAKPELVSIPAGQFFLLRPKSSPKATLECLYNDATLVIRESGTHRFELVVKKEVDDSELASGDGTEDFEDDGLSVLSGQSKKEEEWSFNLDESLLFHKTWSEQGDVAFVWKNTKGDVGEKFQFVANAEVPFSDVGHFLHTAYLCEFEFKYKKSASKAVREDLQQFDFSQESNENALDDDGDREDAETTQLQASMNVLTVHDNSESESDEDSIDELFEDALNGFSPKGTRKDVHKALKAPHINKASLTVLQGHAALYIYDPSVQKLIPQDNSCKFAILDYGEFEYWLAVESEGGNLGVDITPLVNPFFDMSARNFIFNYNMENITLSYMLEFESEALFVQFQKAWTRALWEGLNQKSWVAVSANEKNCIVDASEDVTRELNLFLQEDEDSDSATDGSSDSDEDDEDNKEDQRGDDDSFDDDAAEEQYRASTALSGNKSLTVSFNNDRSYVTRGNKIGVFKAEEDGKELNFVTAISKVSDTKGKEFEPENPMLYTEDQAMIIQDKNDPSRVYKLNLERGKVVEEYTAGGKDILKYSHSKKFDQLTNEQTFLGISGKSVFRLDPRISGQNKLVVEQNKDYATNYGFSSLATSQDGYVAIGSGKGEIRLFDKLGIRAKTLIPALGEPVKHICISADGKWLLATCDSSLLLVDLTVKEGKNAGSVGFLKPFSKDEMPKIHILKVHPKTAAYMKTSTKQPIQFSKAYFNTGLNQKEQTIVTSTGPFAITWSLKKVLRGDKMSYLIKKYNSLIMEDNFRYGSDNNVILALKDNVKMAKKSKFKSPTAEMKHQNNWNDFLELSGQALKK